MSDQQISVIILLVTTIYFVITTAIYKIKRAEQMRNSYLYDVRAQIQNIYSECVTSEQYKTRVFEWITKHAQENSTHDVYFSDIIEIAQELSGEDW